jgi:hypothetical protein
MMKPDFSCCDAAIAAPEIAIVLKDELKKKGHWEIWLGRLTTGVPVERARKSLL